VLATDYPASRREIVVVDNASTDATSGIVGRYPVRRVFEERRGRPHARNRGIIESSGEIVAFTDADCTVDSDWLTRLIRGFESEDVWAVAGEIFALPPRTGPQRFMAGREERWQRVVLSLPERFAITGNVAFRRETFARVGLFDPNFVTAEDVDFGWRFFADNGLELRYEPGAAVHHQLRPTARALFRQQAGLGYGRAILRERYGLPRGYALGTYAELGRAVATLARAALRRAKGDDLAFPFYEVLVRAALRLGGLAWTLSPRRLRPTQR
jgi:GT2 family glycosyltransferase